MPDIKTRNVITGTIKTLNRSTVLQDKVKGNLTRTKEAAEQQAVTDGEQDATVYATDKNMEAVRISAVKAAKGFDRAGRWGAKETSLNLSRLRYRKNIGNFDIKGKSGKVPNVVYSKTGLADKNASSAVTFRKGKSSVYQAKSHAKLSILSKQASTQKAKKATSVAKAVTRNLVAAVKGIAAGTKAATAVTIAGGWIAVIIVLIVVILGSAITFFGNQESTHIPVSAEVEAYDPLIRKYAEEHGISDYVDLIKAVMMQESGGKGSDPMQASECGYNKKYPNIPNGITDPEYSINVGIENLADCLSQAGVESPVDIEKIKLALQGYNFGNGFISWAKEKYGGYSKAAVREFSEMMAEKNGWSSYGDVSYVAHVIRYYPYSIYSYGMMYYSTGKLGLPVEGMTKADITSPFGPRWGRQHTGTDFGYPIGTSVYASESGTVRLAGWNGGYGKCVIVDHGNGMQTLYAHLNTINVAKGQKVIRGQCIAKTGNTGNSTGPHLHFEVIINGTAVDSMKGWLTIP